MTSEETEDGKVLSLSYQTWAILWWCLLQRPPPNANVSGAIPRHLARREVRAEYGDSSVLG